MPRKRKTEPVLNFNKTNRLVSGVGSGVGLAFVNNYFAKGSQIIRVASGYFQIRGFDLVRDKIDPNAQLKILVRSKHGTEGKNVQQTAIKIIDEILEDLGRSGKPIVEAVRFIVKQMQEKKFFIRDAHDVEPFHCKYYIFDDSLLWHGSANFTKNGLEVNAEQVSLILNRDEILGFIDWFDRVSANSRDLLKPLQEKLENWLKLAAPYDIYLKTLFLLFKDKAREPFLESANYPAYFQKAVIEKALRQIESYGGSLIVAATGLGKTIIGAEIALRLSEKTK